MSSFRTVLDRAVFRLTGPDCGRFLKSMTTNILPTAGSVIYTGFLNYHGRVLTDGFMYKDIDGYLLDVSRTNGSAIEMDLRRYLIGSAVEIIDVSGSMEILFDNRYFPNALKDPRHQHLGFRSIGKFTGVSSIQTPYHLRRTILGIPESPHEIFWGKSHPFSVNLNLMNGISFRKGCYVGQEYIARIRNKGVARKRVFPVGINDGNNKECLETMYIDLYNHGNKRGKLLSRVGKYGLALLSVEDVKKHMIYSIGESGRPQVCPLPGA